MTKYFANLSWKIYEKLIYHVCTYVRRTYTHMLRHATSGGAAAPPDFGRSEGATRQRRRAALLSTGPPGFLTLGASLNCLEIDACKIDRCDIYAVKPLLKSNFAYLVLGTYMLFSSLTCFEAFSDNVILLQFEFSRKKNVIVRQ